MKLPEWSEKIIKAFALLIGAIADGIMLFICFTSQAVDISGKIAFGAIGITIILLIPIVFNARWFKLWLALVTVAVFFDTSFLLAQSDPDRINAVATVDTDQELKRLTKKAEDDAAALQKKQDEYDRATKGDTLRELNNQILLARDDANKSELARSERFKKVESGEITLNPITSSDIFDAIPKSLRSGRELYFYMFGLIAVIIQGMIIFALSERIKKQSWLRLIFSRYIEILQKRIEDKIEFKQDIPKPGRGRPAGSKNKTEVELEDIEKFISTNWMGLRTNKSNKILSQASFMEFYSSRGGFPLGKYKIIKQMAIDREVITPGDEIIIADEDDALEAML